MKKFIYPMALAATALFATACSDKEIVDDIQNIPDSQKEMISFSLSDGTTNTRAGFTGGTTRIVARIQSEASGKSTLYTKTALKAAKDETTDATELLTSFSTVSYYDGNTRFWDDAYGRAAKLSVYAVAIPNSEDATKLTFDKLAGDATWSSTATSNTIQWDVTATTQTSTTLTGEDLVYSNNIQSTGKNGRYVWDYATDPEGYPANNGRTDGHKDGCLQFTQKDGAQASDAGHFDKGHFMFNHALSRLTITLVEGDGFDKTSVNKDKDFKFNKATGNIKLLLFPTNGTFDIKNGTWAEYVTTNYADINQMVGAAATADASASAAATGADTYSAQMLPGYVFNGAGTDATKNVMQFTIDNNTYYVTQKMVYDALSAVTANKDAAYGYNATAQTFTMLQGKNYKLSITVKKTAIADVTATLAPWVDVAGSMEINNAHIISLTLNTSGATCNKDIDLYRLDDNNPGYDANSYDFSYQGKNWFGNYSTDDKHKTTLEQSSLASGKWTTPWFFESNKTYYHFRTVNKGTTIEGTGDSSVNDYFNIAAGAVDDTDPHWGAPMESTSTTWLKYDTDKGYEAHLHYAIGATEKPIAIQELHMMSNINVVLETPNDGGKVKLYDYTEPSDPIGTVVKITRLATKGTVEMGRGLVTPLNPVSPDTWSNTSVTMTPPVTTTAADYFSTTGATNGTQSKPYTYAVVPQSLSRDFTSDNDDDYVGIFIQTPDHNQYYVVKKLSEITATTVSDQRDQTQGQKIQRWYPGHTYTYTFTISKKGIENITCTVADWVTVTGQNTNIDLES